MAHVPISPIPKNAKARWVRKVRSTSRATPGRPSETCALVASNRRALVGIDRGRTTT